MCREAGRVPQSGGGGGMRDEIGRLMGRAGGLLRGKESDVIVLSFPRELSSARGGVADSVYRRRTPPRPLRPFAAGDTRAPRRERLKESEKICRRRRPESFDFALEARYPK